MAKCELNCHECRIKDCGMRSLNAFDTPRSNGLVDSLMKGGRPAMTMHIRIDAKNAVKRLKGTSGGGVGVGVPAAIEMDPEAYVIDQLKAEKNLKG